MADPVWSSRSRAALLQLIGELGHRTEVDELLGRAYDLRGADGPHGVEYSGPELGGWIRVRYRHDKVVAVGFLSL